MATPVVIEDVTIGDGVEIETLVNILSRNPRNGRMYVDEVGHGPGLGVSYVERWPLSGAFPRADDETPRLCVWRVRWAASRRQHDRVRSIYVAIGITTGGIVEAVKQGRRKATEYMRVRRQEQADEQRAQDEAYEREEIEAKQDL